jgi:putative PEP-CTERM system TPR-repeat lipoprotein
MEALGQAQLLAGNTQQAVSTFRKLTSLLPTQAAAQMNLAEACVAAADFDAAGRALKRALELDPQRFDAHRGLAMLALRDLRYADALQIARTMQQLDPKDALGHATEGDIQAKRKNWPAAVAAFQSALRYSDASEAAIKLHVALGAANQAAEADRLAAQWEQRHPNDAAFRFYLGDVAMHQQQFAQAEAQYRAVLLSQPDNAMAMNNIAWLLQKQSKPGAMELAEKANALLPNRAPILDTLASVLAASGRLPDAVKTQRRAIAASPQDPALKLALARYLIQDGKSSEAREQLNALVRVGDPYAAQDEISKLLKSL